MKICLLIPLFLTLFHSLISSNTHLIDDLLTVSEIDAKLNDQLPLTYNTSLMGGLINMPSARMGEAGEIGMGASINPPYRNFNLRMQLTNRIEITGNYRVFKGLKDPMLSPYGFGDFSDRGANIKFALLRGEETNDTLPSLAFGFEDFLGTKTFNSFFVVATQVIRPLNLEATLGWGDRRIGGFFGGFNFMPFHQTTSLLKPLTLTLEYDPIRYKDPSIEPHPKGRSKKTPINFGIKGRFFDFIDASVGYVRGEKVFSTLSATYNFGTSLGLTPKTCNPLPFCPVVIKEPIGTKRTLSDLALDLCISLNGRGLELLDIDFYRTSSQRNILRIKVVNAWYRVEEDVYEQLKATLCAYLPENIDRVYAVIEDEGFPIQEYRFSGEFLRLYRDKKICSYELLILTPLREVSTICYKEKVEMFQKRRDRIRAEIVPKTNTFFGSASGKFKYSVGASCLIDGFLFNSLYYRTKLSYMAFTNLKNNSSIDLLNPSQLINVRTDTLLYAERLGFSLDEAYVQKNLNLGRGSFFKLAGGYFEELYGGIALQYLYYPVSSCLALGFEGGVFLRRNIQSLTFSKTIRKLKNFEATYVPFTGSQLFFNVYFDAKELQLDFKVKMGKFLANDYGARFEIARYFPSGMRILCWYTLTGANDRVNGARYFDKGIEISLPLDLFYSCSSRNFWNYGMSAWLRDVGQTASNGFDLFDLIKRQRVCLPRKKF